MSRWRERAAHKVDEFFSGSVDGRVYDVLRIGVAAIFLVRHSDWLRPWLFLEHHRFVHGLLFLGSSAAEPRLHSPLLLGLPLGPSVNDALVYVRTGLAALLLIGVRVPFTAAALALVSYVLLAEDRYRYYHHLFLLYVAVACLALTPLRTRFSVERLFLGKQSSAASPIWPLQLIRALVCGTYLAAGISKLDAQWLRGEALEHLARLHLLKGDAFEVVHHLLGYAGIATVSCITELALPLLFVFEKTRRLGIVIACGFHLGISLSMPVYSFGAQMAVLTLAFWPRAVGPARSPQSC